MYIYIVTFILIGIYRADNANYH